MCGPDARTTVYGGRFSDVRRLGEVTSTNDEVAALAVAGAPDGVVVVADHQRAGRGRRGRVWESPGGGESLLVSVLVRPIPDLLTLAAGLAVVDAVAEVAGLAVTLKWPNDVVVDGLRGCADRYTSYSPSGVRLRAAASYPPLSAAAPPGRSGHGLRLSAHPLKLAGLLAEVHGDGANRYAVIGLGLNLRWTSPLPEGACSLAGLGAESCEREPVLQAWLAALERRLAQDPPTLLDHYRASCATLGRQVRVETPAGTFEGTATDVDPTGHLIVDDRQISAGDVIHLR